MDIALQKFNELCVFLTLAFCLVESAQGSKARYEVASDEHYIKLPRFWTNVGFAPPAPLPLNNSAVADELLSQDVRLNLEIIAGLPNAGIETIRIHWLLSLVRFRWVVSFPICDAKYSADCSVGSSISTPRNMISLSGMRSWIIWKKFI